MGSNPTPSAKSAIARTLRRIVADEAEATQARALRTASGVDGGVVGYNLNSVPFATRFEWMWIVQFHTRADDRGARENFERIRYELASCCRNYVEADLKRPLPGRFADGADVKVRHTVMFDFKPDASAEAGARNVSAIRRMGKLPMVRHYMVERTTQVLPGPAEMEWQVIGDFGSLADFKAYAEAPIHLDIRDDFKAHTARVAFLDVAL